MNPGVVTNFPVAARMYLKQVPQKAYVRPTRKRSELLWELDLLSVGEFRKSCVGEYARCS